MSESETTPPKRRISRRVVIGGIVGTAALAAGGIGIAALVDGDDGSAASTGSDSSSVPAGSGGGTEQEALTRIGRRYLAVVPAERDATVLARDLRASGVDTDDIAAATGLRDAVTRDYGAGAVLLLDGWLISRSEGRYAALIALRS